MRIINLNSPLHAHATTRVVLTGSPVLPGRELLLRTELVARRSIQALQRVPHPLTLMMCDLMTDTLADSAALAAVPRPERAPSMG